MALSPTPYLALKKSDVGEIFPLTDMNTNTDTINSMLVTMGARKEFVSSLDNVSWMTIASGFKFKDTAANKFVKRGNFGFFEIQITNDNAITLNAADGNFTNAVIGSLNPGFVMNRDGSFLRPIGGGVDNFSGWISDGGTLNLAACDSSKTSIAANTSIVLCGGGYLI